MAQHFVRHPSKTRAFVISLLLIILSVLLLPPPISSQDSTPPVETLTETPTLTETATETPTLTPTASATETETGTPTLTPTPSPSETPTEGLTETATATATLSDTQTASATETATAEVFGTLPSPTETAPMTASATATAFPPEPALTPLVSDTFDGGLTPWWMLGAGWALVASEGGQALQGTNTTEAVTFAHNTLGDTAVQARVLPGAGTVRLILRQSAAGAYSVTLDAGGQVRLYRGAALLGAAQATPGTPEQWRTLRLSAIGPLVRAAVDGVEVIAAEDDAPLPPGTVAIAGDGVVLVDDVGLWAIATIPSVQPATPIAFTPTPGIPNILLNVNGGIGIQSMLPDATLDYVVVDDSAGLNAALSAINNGTFRPGALYRIYIKPGVYDTTTAVAINNKQIRIYGMGSDVTNIRANIISQSLFYVASGSSLELYDLTITGISSSYPQYGGAINNLGITSVYRVTFIDNKAQFGGGAIQNGGGAIHTSLLHIENSTFRNNGGTTSLGGGAIQNNAIIDLIRCTDFESNDAFYGGGILNPDGLVTIRNSRFNGNTTQTLGGAITNVFGSPGVDANDNWWPLWLWTGGYPGDINTQYPNQDTLEYVIVTTVVPADPLPPGASDCSLLKLPSTTPTAAEELTTYYGVDIVNPGGWTSADADQIRIGVRNTALALAIQSGRSPIDAFVTVMRKSGNNTPKFVKDTVANGGLGFAYCLTDNGANPTTITCYYDALAITQYTVIHELGHVFNDRSAQNGKKPLVKYVDDTDVSDQDGQSYPMTDSIGDQVMGRFRDPTTLTVIWKRGPRGWGSGPADAITDFQQHPPDRFPNDTSDIQIDETSADMFLNWVYRIADPNFTDPVAADAFRNISWSIIADSYLGTTANQCYNQAGCPDTTRNPGNARFNWTREKMALIFADQAWNDPQP